MKRRLHAHIRFDWCRYCSERYSVRWGKAKDTLGRDAWYEYSEPHECPTTCKHCNTAHAVTRRGATLVSNPHMCDGRRQADEQFRRDSAAYMQDMARTFRRALNGG